MLAIVLLVLTNQSSGVLHLSFQLGCVINGGNALLETFSMKR